MKTLKVDENDLDFGSYAEGIDEIIECLKLDIGSALQEFFLAEDIGRDLEIFKDKPTVDEIAVEIARIIANEPRVQLINDVTMEVEEATRTAYATFQIEEVESGEQYEFGMEVV